MQELADFGMAAFTCSRDGAAMAAVPGADGVLRCGTCGHRTDEPGTGTLADAFDVTHRQWGLRGDPHVWSALRDDVGGQPTPQLEADVRAALVRSLASVALIDLDELGDDPVPREQFAHGGMSSGMVDVGWWRTKGIPLLVARAMERRPPS